MQKTIEKRCIVEDDAIIIRLSDTRDNYIYPTSLGEIGEINVYQDGIFIVADQNEEEKIVARRESVLLATFKEIFNEDNYDQTSKEYYRKINTMIENGTLKSLGYTITDSNDDTTSYRPKR